MGSVGIDLDGPVVTKFKFKMANTDHEFRLPATPNHVERPPIGELCAPTLSMLRTTSMGAHIVKSERLG